MNEEQNTVLSIRSFYLDSWDLGDWTIVPAPESPDPLILFCLIRSIIIGGMEFVVIQSNHTSWWCAMSSGHIITCDWYVQTDMCARHFSSIYLISITDSVSTNSLQVCAVRVSIFHFGFFAERGQTSVPFWLRPDDCLVFVSVRRRRYTIVFSASRFCVSSACVCVLELCCCYMFYRVILGTNKFHAHQVDCMNADVPSDTSIYLYMHTAYSIRI